MKISKEKIEIAMARAQLDVAGLAEKAKMPLPTLVSARTKGTCKPMTVGRIAKALEVDVTEIIED